jgi:DnaJ family protein C protein 2
VPVLGNPDDHIDVVNAFYDFWFEFKSWRDFKVDKDHDLEKAESREEKRWMEKENAKLKASKLKEEAARVRALVEDAIRIDPRHVLSLSHTHTHTHTTFIALLTRTLLFAPLLQS